MDYIPIKLEFQKGGTLSVTAYRSDYHEWYWQILEQYDHKKTKKISKLYTMWWQYYALFLNFWLWFGNRLNLVWNDNLAAIFRLWNKKNQIDNGIVWTIQCADK